ncbi:hypothetical protein AB0M28_14825 [Streptomyces sp. NPDC051940]|uniref:DUF7144 family membrane protein n=1 Tax=Streptomyces sp. NPDC051940 TaxID=3155675 RepID=UPI003441317B
MSQSPPSAGPSWQSEPAPRAGSAPSRWVTGGATFAGVLMIVYGCLGIVQGITGIAEDDVYKRVGDYVFKFDTTTWGWIHLIVGVALVLVGAGILKGSEAARGLGVAVACVAIVLNFMWLPYVPFWAAISIAIGVYIVWALCHDNPGLRRS